MVYYNCVCNVYECVHYFIHYESSILHEFLNIYFQGHYSLFSMSLSLMYAWAFFFNDEPTAWLDGVATLHNALCVWHSAELFFLWFQMSLKSVMRVSFSSSHELLLLCFGSS